VPDPTSSSGFNRYRYAKNNPLLYVDPSGHQGCSVFNDLCYNFDPWKPLRDMWDSAPESAPKAVEDLATNAVEEINASGKLAGNAAERLVPPAPDAITVGGSVSANLGVPGFSIDMGGEVVINFNSGEVTGFSYNGPGAAYGASAILTGYGGMVWNLPDNSAYSGPFESVNITAAGGEGGSFTYFWAPGDEPVIGAFTPNNAKGISFGYGYGAGGSVSYNQTEYTELFELNLQKDSPEEEIIPPEWKKDEWGR